MTTRWGPLRVLPAIDWPDTSCGPSTDEGLRDFLHGRSDGSDLLHALYDPILAEPIPPCLRALLRRH